jgi:glucose-6-phosphate 1-dehydrogenase
MSNNGSPRPENHVLVLFGATGDLAKRKLLPGLFHLHAAGLLPREYRVIGTSPPKFALTEEQFRQRAEQACADFCITKPTDPSWPSFAERLSFAAAEPGNTSDLEAAASPGGCTTWPCLRPRSPRSSACSVTRAWPPASPG